MAKEDFKLFVRENKDLVDYVRGGGSWQELYEVYSLYGSDSDVWNKYRTNNKGVTNNNYKLRDLMDMVKDIDLEKVRNGIDSIQKTISMIQDLGVKSTNNQNRYEPRYRYQHLDD